MFFIFILISLAFAQECNEGITCKMIYTAPQTLTVTGSGAWTSLDKFYSSASLVKIVIGKDITSIDHSVLQKCNSLQTIECEEGCKLKSLTANAFKNSGKLTKVNIPTLETIGESAFENSLLLSKFDFPNVKTIEKNAFKNSGLKAPTFPTTLQTIGVGAFDGCPIESFVVTAGNPIYSSDSNGVLFESRNNVKSLLLYPPLSKNENYVVPTGVTLIKENALKQIENLKTIDLNEVVTVEPMGIFGCKLLKEIKLGKATTDLRKRSFRGCKGIEKFTVAEENPFFEGKDGILFTKNVENKALIKYPPAKQIAEKYSIPAGIKVIYDNAFENVQGIKELTIENDVYSIHSNAFEGCSGLKSVTITAPITSVGAGVFDGLYNLTTVVIGDNVKMIGKNMFHNCMNLNTFTMGKGVMSIEANAFTMTMIKSIEIPDECVFVMKNAFFYCSELETVKIGKKVKEISRDAFAGCSKLNSVDFSKAEGLQRIDKTAFSGCKALKTVELSSSIKVIAGSAFADTGLKTVKFLGKAKPNYCDVTTFDGTEVKEVNVPTDYEHQQFCGKQVKKA